MVFFFVKRKGHSPVDLIIHSRRLIEKVFTVLIIFSLICIPMVGVNYDLTKYLPDSSPSAQALDIMEDEFTYPGMGRVMLEDVTLYEAKNVKDRIADVEGVDMVMWCDLETNIYGSSAFIDYTDIEDYYKDGKAYMDVIFLEKDSSSRTHKAVREIEQIVGDRGLVAGSAVSDTNLGPTINAEVARVMVLAVIIIYLILTLTTTSWFEPVLFLSVLGIAIIINMGSNIIFGEISFLSNAVGAVLQLACSMDYSIFLLHAFTEERANGAEPEQAMANALRSAVSSIGASGATTIVGFAAMVLMNFGGYGAGAGKRHRAEPCHRAAADARADPAQPEYRSEDPTPAVRPQAVARLRGVCVQSPQADPDRGDGTDRPLLCRAGHGRFHLWQ